MPSIDRLREHPKAVTDGPYLLDMLVPLADGEHFGCRHFDAKSRRCTAYEQRPLMCRAYPYAGTCEHCGGQLKLDQGTAWIDL